MKIEVLQRHIDTGVPCMEEACPVANAILDRLFGSIGLSGVYVSNENVILIFIDGSEREFKLPWEVNEIIDIYDRTGVMYPFGFIMTEVITTLPVPVVPDRCFA